MQGCSWQLAFRMLSQELRLTARNKFRLGAAYAPVLVAVAACAMTALAALGVSLEVGMPAGLTSTIIGFWALSRRVRLEVHRDVLVVCNLVRSYRVSYSELQSLEDHFYPTSKGIRCVRLVRTRGPRVPIHATTAEGSEYELRLRTLKEASRLGKG